MCTSSVGLTTGGATSPVVSDSVSKVISPTKRTPMVANAEASSCISAVCETPGASPTISGCIPYIAHATRFSLSKPSTPAAHEPRSSALDTTYACCAKTVLGPPLIVPEIVGTGETSVVSVPSGVTMINVPSK